MIVFLVSAWLVLTLSQIAFQGCSLYPMITDVDKINNSIYIKWIFQSCSPLVAMNYQIQFTDRCDNILTYYTETNETTLVVSFNIIDNICFLDYCLIRLRGIMIDGNYTQFSPCVLINYQLMSSRLIFTLQDVCVPIVGCHPLTPSFYINGEIFAWPYSQEPYNLMLSSIEGNLSVCLRNVTYDIMLIQFCHSNVPQDSCYQCSNSLGIVNFRSRANIMIIKPNSSSRKVQTITSDINVQSTNTDFYAFSRGFNSFTLLDQKPHNFVTVSDTNLFNDYTITQHDKKIWLTISLAVAIGSFSVIVITVIIIIVTIIWLRKRKQEKFNINQTSPIYEEIITDNQGVSINTVTCSAYEATRMIKMDSCPAYEVAVINQ